MGNQIAFAIVPVFEADGSVEMAVMAYRTMSEIHVAALGMSMTLIVGVALAMLCPRCSPGSSAAASRSRWFP
mgnify:CR=1 FL=1